MQSEFHVTEADWPQLEEQFDQLCEWAAWELYKNNPKTSHTDEQEDMSQEIRMAMLRAGAYYKRQTYIERCFEVADEFIEDEFLGLLLEQLRDLWKNKTRHGASRQKFGPYQEKLLTKIVNKVVPRSKRPNKKAPLIMDSKFIVYCKAIMWNSQKSMGKKITREKAIRKNLVSLSEYEYLKAG